ncbi:hypothetical protein Tco_0635559 [Tanacetum coccineum]
MVIQDSPDAGFKPLGEEEKKDAENSETKNSKVPIEPKKVIQALTDPSWIEAMPDELLQTREDEKVLLIRTKQGWLHKIHKRRSEWIIIRKDGREVYVRQQNLQITFKDNFRGRSLVSSAVYYEVTPPDTFPLRRIFGGVTEQYFQIQDYALWDIIENGNSFNLVARTTTNADGTSTSTIPSPVTTEEKVQKKNDVKSRSMLLMALLNEHQLTFNQYKDAKTLFEAIQTRFGGNDATKKTQKTLLKQTSTESLDSIFNMLQKIVSQLAIFGENISQEDLNLKFLRILPSEWNTHVVVWRNKLDLDSMSFDDLYNNFKIVKQEFNTCLMFQVSTASSTVSTDSTLDSIANLSDATVYAFLRSKEPRKQGLEKQEHLTRRTEFWQKHFSKAMVAIDGAGFDWSYMADEEVPTYLVLMAFSDSEIEKLKKEKESNQIKIDNFENASKSLDKLIGSQISDNNRKGVGYNVVPPPPTGLFAPPTIDLSNSGLKEFQQPEFEGYGFKANKGVCENSSNEIKKTTDAPIIEDWVSDCDEDESEVRILKSDNVQQKPKQANQPRKVSENPRYNRTNWNEKKTQKLGVGFQFTKKACFVCGSFNHLIKDCDFHDKKMVQKPVLNNVKKGTGQREVRLVWNNTIRVNHQNFSNSRRNFVPTAVLTKSGIVLVSAARPINTAAPKSFVNSVNTAKGNRVTSAVGEQGIIVVKSSACWTVTVDIVNDGEQQLSVTFDGQTIAITEVSVRRHL